MPIIRRRQEVIIWVNKLQELLIGSCSREKEVDIEQVGFRDGPSRFEASKEDRNGWM